MALTLVDYFKLSKDPIAKGFIMDLLRQSDLIGMVPFVNINGLQVSGVRSQTIPATAFRAIGGGYTESTGNVENIEETISMLGGDVKFDRVFDKTSNNLKDPMEVAMRQKAESIAFNFNNYFINGDAAVDPDGFEGVKKRVSNMPSRQTIWLDSNGAGTGDSLKVLASSTTEHQFVDALHKANKYVNGATHYFCNETTWLGFGQVARRLNLYGQITDPLGRMWDTIAGKPYIDVGLKSDKSTEIITNTEDPGDGGNDATSIYVVRMDTDSGLHGLQLEGTSPEPYDPLAGGEMESGPQYLRRIDWGVGLFNLSNYCIARIAGFKMAAS